MPTIFFFLIFRNFPFRRLSKTVELQSLTFPGQTGQFVEFSLVSSIESEARGISGFAKCYRSAWIRIRRFEWKSRIRWGIMEIELNFSFGFARVRTLSDCGLVEVRQVCSLLAMA